MWRVIIGNLKSSVMAAVSWESGLLRIRRRMTIGPDTVPRYVTNSGATMKLSMSVVSPCFRSWRRFKVSSSG